MSPGDKPEKALFALICCGQYMAAAMPGHGDLTALMSQIALSLTMWVPSVWIHPEVERFVRIAVSSGITWPTFALPE